MTEINPKRVRRLNTAGIGSGPVLYWMDRDQRVEDNWALFFSISQAKLMGQSVSVVFCLEKKNFEGKEKQLGFVIEGLMELEQKLAGLNIDFYLVEGDPGEKIVQLIKLLKAGLVVVDFSPLKPARRYREDVAEKLPVALMETDAHNIVPAWVVSPKQEFAAYTFRPKFSSFLDDFLVEFPPLRKLSFPRRLKNNKNNWLMISKSAKPSGEIAAQAALKNFITNRLPIYGKYRNDPNEDAQSGLSCYLNFGQLSAQRAALQTLKLRQNASTEAFLEELMVRKELSENFCFYCKDYDNFEGFPDWAKKTLNDHRKDERDFIYNQEEFETGKTHDQLWNAAQAQMVKTGLMHGFMRMYWAKKILEWSKDPETAQETAIYLNDKYELDGSSPNGYTGIAWSIGGVHDRAWGERPVFGKVRYMSYNGCKAKFDVEKYINDMTSL